MDQKAKPAGNIFRLFEHEYGLDDNGLLQSTLEDAAVCFLNYPKMSIPEMDLSLSDLLALADIKKCQLPVPLSIFNTTVQCYLDCLILYQSKVIIFDWKVSKTTASRFDDQLKTYGLAISRSGWGAGKDLKDICIYEANFYTGQIKKYPLNDGNILETEDFIFDSVRRIEAIVGGKKFAELDAEDFPMCENLRVCQNCNFQKFCL